jgi:nicotinate-nucleotide pyrophosphorylase (carboxylating)
MKITMTIETLKAAREAITGGNYYKSILLDKLLDLILIEDLVNPDSLVMPFLLGDPTAGIFASQEKNSDKNKIIEADFLLKQDACVAGLPMIEIAMGALCAALDRQSDLPRISIEHHTQDGTYIRCTPPNGLPRTRIATLTGPADLILIAERTMLNLMQRMSGVATMTRSFVDIAVSKGVNLQVLDTRKTMPGLRLLDKYAVLAGGGTNHRFSLAHAIMLKDNHIAAAGSIEQAMQMARAADPDGKALFIEIEVDTLDGLKQALDCGAQRVMLDNFSPEQVRQAVAFARVDRGLAHDDLYIEVSGGIDSDTFADYLISGVSGISIGALTHSARNVDISLDFKV